MTNLCLTCKLARWRKTSDGKKLHPSGDGHCTWQMPTIDLPESFYYVGNNRHKIPAPSGGFISRRDELPVCLTYKAKRNTL